MRLPKYFCALFLAHTLSSIANEDSYQLLNANVVDVATGSVSKQHIVISEGKIQHLDLIERDGLTKIDISGKYVLPGLIDAHVHTSDFGEGIFPQWLYYGVTTVRDMGGDYPRLLKHKKDIQKSPANGPDLLISSPILESKQWLEAMIKNTDDDSLSHRIGIESDEDIEQAILRLRPMEFDHIKIRTAKSPKVYLDTVKALQELGKPVVGHLPFFTNILRNAADAGQHSIEHSLFISLTQQDATARKATYQKMLDNSMYVVPTMVAGKYFRDASHEEVMAQFAHEVYQQRVPKSVFAQWHQDQMTKFQEHPRNWRKLLKAHREYLKEMHQAGIPLVAGSDTAIMFLLPGQALHQELENMVNLLGLSPAEALKTATINAAKMLKRQSDKGQVKSGFEADLLIVSTNPLKDIANAQDIYAVVRHGKLIDGHGRAKLLEKAHASVAMTNEQSGVKSKDALTARQQKIDDIFGQLLTDSKPDQNAHNVSTLTTLNMVQEHASGKLNNLGYFLLYQGEVKLAEKVFTFNTQQFPENLNALDSLAEFYFRMDDFSKSTALYQNVLRMNPNETDAQKRHTKAVERMLDEMK